MEKPGNKGQFANVYKCELLKHRSNDAGWGSTGNGPRGITEYPEQKFYKKAFLDVVHTKTDRLIKEKENDKCKQKEKGTQNSI